MARYYMSVSEDGESCEVVDAADYDEMASYCTMLENIVMERGINADRIIRGDRAIARLKELGEEV